MDQYLRGSCLFTAYVGGAKSISGLSQGAEGDGMADLEVVTQALVNH